ncbi:MAG: HAD family phosphatase [Pseudomonadota bacterium]
MAERVRAVLWDLGHTLVDWDPARVYRQLLSDAAAVEDFLGGVCTMEWHTEHDRGAPMAENRKALIARFPEHRALIEAWELRWEEMFDGWVTGMEALVSELEAAGVPQYGLTNLPAEKWPHIQKTYPAIARFADVVVSGEEKRVKPDPEIFSRTIERIDEPAQSVLFIDDRAENIRAGEQAGFIGHVFTSAGAARRAMRAHGLPV